MSHVIKFGIAAAVVAVSAARLCPLCGGAPVGTAALAAQEVQAPDTAVVRFALSGMTCGSCAVTARVALQRVAGVYGATVSYDSASAEVRYDPRQTAPARIAEDLERMTGYRATVIADSTGQRRRESGG